MQYLIAFCSRSEASSDVISDGTVGQAGTDTPDKFGGSSSHGSRDIRLSHFVMNDHYDAGVRRSSHKGKMPRGVFPKIYYKICL